MEEVYEKLLELWNTERVVDELQQIPETIFDELSDYMGHLRRTIRLGEKNSPNTLVKKAELEMVVRLLESLMRIRMNKVVEAAFKQTTLENALPFERRTLSDIQRALSQHEAKIRNGLSSPKSFFIEEKEKLEVVVFLKDFPKFVGEDLQSYGPFKEGDIATVYYSNVQALMQKKIVRPIKLI